MSEDKKSLIELVPDSVDNAVKNITDKPTQNMGTTFANIWYLVFSAISQDADKRKLKYSYALKEFENELKEKISKISEDKLVEPDIQIIAKALEEAKYCIEKDDLRRMFVSLISSSLNSDNYTDVHPLFVHTITYLKPLDVKILFCLTHNISILTFNYLDIKSSSQVLSNLGLIGDRKIYFIKDYKELYIDFYKNPNALDEYDYINILMCYHPGCLDFYEQLQIKYPNYLFIEHRIQLTEFGCSFMKVCSGNMDEELGHIEVLKAKSKNIQIYIME